MTYNTDTIVAQASAPGRGGVGIVRVSGPQALSIAQSILGANPKIQEARYQPFLSADGEVLDKGISLYFKAPNSFTGEDVLELQGHGGPVVMDMLVSRVVELGARVARPGEFSERAFLNDKIDLAQAEAIADLIDSQSEQAARTAIRSLQGDFSNRVNGLVNRLIELRIYVEAAIDFPDEEIDFLSDGKIESQTRQLLVDLESLLAASKQGAILREGMRVAIAGKPNAGKSSLLNALAQKESAIVTDIEGTTRDLLQEVILIDGMPLHIIDTAGLRESADKVEQIGIDRARKAIEEADLVLLMVAGTDDESLRTDPFIGSIIASKNFTLIRNKSDLTGDEVAIKPGQPTEITLSAKTGDGLQLLREHLKQVMGYQQEGEGSFLARRRHLDALTSARASIEKGLTQLTGAQAGELLADDLREAQLSLSEITGEFSADDLLGRIFSSFCIGK